MSILKDQQYCINCHCMVNAVLSKRMRSNGAPLLFWRCPNGDHNTRSGAMFLSNRDLKDLDVSLDDLPTVGDPAPQKACEVKDCERPGFEEHHWAPKSIFPDSHLWPRSDLCKYHHDLWHKTIEQHWRTKIDLERFGVTVKKAGG